jgi:hypothetical protein
VLLFTPPEQRGRRDLRAWRPFTPPAQRGRIR